jgi:hypothetical protein
VNRRSKIRRPEIRTGNRRRNRPCGFLIGFKGSKIMEYCGRHFTDVMFQKSQPQRRSLTCGFKYRRKFPDRSEMGPDRQLCGYGRSCYSDGRNVGLLMILNCRFFRPTIFGVHNTVKPPTKYRIQPIDAAKRMFYG